MALSFHTLRVADLIKQTPDATTISFDPPQALADDFAFLPGQHLNIRFVIDGKEARRSYSINSCPYLDGPLQVTVKRVAEGLVSNYVNDVLRVGDELEVMPPTGRFVADIHPGHYKHYFLFGAGSGITPLMAMVQSILHEEPYSFVDLFYGNRNKSSILFYNELQTLQQQFPDRLGVEHVLSAPYSDWSSIWGWTGRRGRIDPKSVRDLIEKHPPKAQRTECFICGPGTMNKTVRATLLDLGVPSEWVHVEHFQAEATNKVQPVEAIANARLIAQLNGQQLQETIAGGQTILQVLKEKAHDPPYSCESGICATCTAKVLQGKVHMKACMGLDETEIAQGHILTCQALPLTPHVEVTFDG